jgi:hypothetical protein
MGVNITDQLFELWWLTEYDDTTCGWIVHEAYMAIKVGIANFSGRNKKRGPLSAPSRFKNVS